MGDAAGTGIPWWEVLLGLLVVAGGLALATRGKAPPIPDDLDRDKVYSDIQGLDRILTSHAFGILQLGVLGGAALATMVRLGHVSSAMVFANLVVLLTGGSIATWALTLIGEPGSVAAMEGKGRIGRSVRRVYRRGEALRVATWFLFPMVVLIVVTAYQLRSSDSLPR